MELIEALQEIVRLADVADPGDTFVIAASALATRALRDAGAEVPPAREGEPCASD